MRTLALLVAAIALAGCALRPRYAQFVGKETTQPVRLQVVEKRRQIPVPWAPVEVGEGPSKLHLKTDLEGYFFLPVDKKLLNENALIVIGVPAGYGRTEVLVTVFPTFPDPVAPVPASDPAVEAADAGR